MVRLLRLLRLLSLLKVSEQLRVIVVGLVQGLKSSVYIVFLLLLVTYMFAVIGASHDTAQFLKILLRKIIPTLALYYVKIKTFTL